MIEIFPAIDLKDSKVVRLSEGKYDCVNIYSEDPCEIAANFLSCGARNLHVVDLNGAKDGSPVNREQIKELAKIKGLFMEVGGGIRNMKAVEDYLSLGADRVIIGTAAIKDYPFLKEAVKTFGEAIAVGVDTKEGKIAVNGWIDRTDVDGVDFCIRLRDDGVKTVIYTDISKDGMLKGTNLEIYRVLSAIDGLDIIASGGISFESEISELDRMGIYGAIVGKAIYENKLDLKNIIKMTKSI